MINIKIREWCKIFLTGIGQIMLQKNWKTGLLFLIGIFIGSPLMGVSAILGSAAGLAAALLLRYELQHIKDGLYGFNGALVGLAIAFFYAFSPIAVLMVIAGGALSTVVMNFMLRRFFLPAYTAPFVVVTWFIMVTARFTGLQPITQPPGGEQYALGLLNSFA